MQADGHVISWEEFQNAFRAHHIPEGLMERKLNQFLALTQYTSRRKEMKNFHWTCECSTTAVSICSECTA
jgi:hypothetical protein